MKIAYVNVGEFVLVLYQPFPSTSPEFVPRDEVADWLEQYVTTQNLVVWTNSELQAHPPIRRPHWSLGGHRHPGRRDSQTASISYGRRYRVVRSTLHADLRGIGAIPGAIHPLRQFPRGLVLRRNARSRGRSRQQRH